MSEARHTVLVVDDIETNRLLLSTLLARAEYAVDLATNGEESLELLQAQPSRYSAVLLDRMMPGMDGMEVLRRIKDDADLRGLPVIMQTAMVQDSEILEGLEAGAFHYLTKPIRKSTLLAVVGNAIAEHSHYLELHAELEKAASTLAMMRSGGFECRTTDDANRLAKFLANLCPRPERTFVGLAELLINGVEHGNLGISYVEKTRLNADMALHAEIERRLTLPEHAGKFVDVQYERSDDAIRFRICDQGEGFDWQAYVEVDPSRVLDSHGRGIAMAKLVSFDSVEYLGTGSEVVAEVALEAPVAVAVAVG